MGKYKVCCYEKVYSSIIVEALDNEDAKSKAFDIIANEGTPDNAEVTGREFNTTYVEKVKEC